MVGAVLEATESRKHQANDEKCLASGCPLTVDCYEAWGREASNFLAQVIATCRLADTQFTAKVTGIF